MAEFSDRLVARMQSLEMTAAALSDKTGVSEAAISRYVNGRRHPSIDNLIAIADALYVTTDYLLGVTDDVDDKRLIDTYAIASSDDKRVIWTLLERYGENNDYTDRPIHS